MLCRAELAAKAPILFDALAPGQSRTSPGEVALCRQTAEMFGEQRDVKQEQVCVSGGQLRGHGLPSEAE